MTQALLVLGIVATIAWAARTPQAGPGQSAQASGDQGATSQPDAVSPRLADYAAIYQRDLRRPLFDPRLVEVVVKPPPAPKPTFTLTGTVTEPGFTYALFRTRAGETKLVSVGESVEGAEVLAIGENAATVSFAGQTLELTVQKEGG